MKLTNNNNYNHGIEYPFTTAIVAAINGFGCLINHITTTIAIAYEDKFSQYQKSQQPRHKRQQKGNHNNNLKP
jgi:hypothetical protein